jgi:hypothetical protein
MLICEFKDRMAWFRVSQECLDHCIKHYSLDVLNTATEAFEDPLEYIHEPDLKLLETIGAILGYPYIRMPSYIKPKPFIWSKKSNPEYGKEQLAKIKKSLAQMMLKKEK